MKVLSSILDECVPTLTHLKLSEEKFTPTEAVESLNESDFMLTLHGMNRYTPKIYLNEAKRDFYGFDENDQSHKNALFYMQTLHPSSYFILVQSLQFFSRNDPGYFLCEYNLRNSEGDYEKVYGASKTVAWNSAGKPSYVLSITCRSADYPLLSARHSLGLTNCLSSREEECLKHLVSGKSNGEIASSLCLSERTIEKHVSSLFQKAKIKNRADFLSQSKHWL